jgi:hypothetical protein
VLNVNAQLTAIYTLQFRSALNKDYYGAILYKTQWWNGLIEFIIAITATGSGVSGFLALLRDEPYGRWIWGAITLVSALLALGKPIVQLNKRIERLTRLYAGHSDNYTNLVILISRIQRHGRLTPEFLNAFEAAEAKFLELSKDDDPYPDMKLLASCEAKARKRHPPELAWYPKKYARHKFPSPGSSPDAAGA